MAQGSIYQCKDSDFRTDHRDHLERHLKQEHLSTQTNETRFNDQPNNIVNCTKENNTYTEHQDDPFKSKESDDSISNFGNLSEESEIKGGKLNQVAYVCPACGTKANNKILIVKHIREKHPNACTKIETLLNFDFYKIKLNVPVVKRKKEQEKEKQQFSCSECSKVFYDNWKYKMHMRSHNDDKPFSCNICNFCATTKMTIRDHIHRKHNNAKNSKILFQTLGLNGQLEKIELPVPERKFICELCYELFLDNYLLKQHRMKTHLEALPFKCISCDHKENTKADILLHCLVQHPNNLQNKILHKGKPIEIGQVKPPKCTQCNKVFAYQSQLKIHQKHHTGEKDSLKQQKQSRGIYP